MQLTIFGASRGVGRAAVDAALAAGHRVTAFARGAGSAAVNGATLLGGDVLDREQVRAALTGSDAVLVTLGVTPGQRKSTPADVCSRGTQTILIEMRAAAIDRIAVVTSYGVGTTRSRTPFVFSLIAKTLLREIMADKERQEQLVRASELRWTIVQPLAGCGKTPGAVSNPPVPPKASSLFGHNATALLSHRSSFRRNIRVRSGHRGFFRNLLGLTDAPPTGKPNLSIDGSRKTTRVARADVAAVCIDALANGTFLRECVAVSAP